VKRALAVAACVAPVLGCAKKSLTEKSYAVTNVDKAATCTGIV
jgi:hypothetical protein